MAELAIRLDPPTYGWIEIHIKPLTGDEPIHCSETSDPFQKLFGWLEQIAGGARHAVWHVEEEGLSARLIFLAGSQFLGDEQSYLILCRSYDGAIDQFKAIAVDRTDLLQNAYAAFRTMVTSDEYDAQHWELHPRWYEVDLNDEEAFDAARANWPFSGERLHSLRSPIVEAFLAEAGQAYPQFVLDIAGGSAN